MPTRNRTAAPPTARSSPAGRPAHVASPARWNLAIGAALAIAAAAMHTTLGVAAWLRAQPVPPGDVDVIQNNQLPSDYLGRSTQRRQWMTPMFDALRDVDLAQLLSTPDEPVGFTLSGVDGPVDATPFYAMAQYAWRDVNLDPGRPRPRTILWSLDGGFGPDLARVGVRPASVTPVDSSPARRNQLFLVTYPEQAFAAPSPAESPGRSAGGP